MRNRMQHSSPLTATAEEIYDGTQSQTEELTEVGISDDDVHEDVSSTSDGLATKLLPSTKFDSPPPPLSTLKNNQAGAFHPDFMFCGECTSCAPASDANLDDAANEYVTRMAALRYLDNDNDKNDDDDGYSNGSNEAAAVIVTRLVVENFHSTSQPLLMIQSILQPLAGVTKVLLDDDKLNYSNQRENKTIVVHHDGQTSPNVLVDTLREMNFWARLQPITSGTDATSSSSADASAENIDSMDLESQQQQQQQQQQVRSSFTVQGVCCASEVPAVRKIVRPLKGVSKVQINLTTKIVYVHHNPNLITSQEIAEALTRQGFPALVKTNGAREVQVAAEIGSKLHVGQTTLHVEGILAQEDVPHIQQILLTVPGVRRIGVNVPEGIVYVQHDVTHATAQHIQHVFAGSHSTNLTNTATMTMTATATTADGGNDDTPPQKTTTITTGATTTTRFYNSTITKDAQKEILKRANRQQYRQVTTSNFVESTLLIPNLREGHVSRGAVLQKAIQQNYIRPQIRAYYPNVPSKTLKVEHDPQLVSAEDLCLVLQRYGLSAQVNIDGAEENLALPVVEDYGASEHNNIASSQYGLGEEDSSSFSGLHLNVILSGIFWFISMLSFIGEDDDSSGWDRLKYAGLLSVLMGLPPIAIKAWRTVRRGQFDANCMMVIAAMGALLLGEFDEAASVAFLFAVSEWLEARATLRARRALANIVRLRPEHAHVIVNTETTSKNTKSEEIRIVPASNVPLGALVRVRTGDKIVADGVVVEGTTSIDESSLTGEALPVTKHVGETVSGGSINIGSTPIKIKTTTTVEDSAVSRLIRLVEEAQANTSPTEKLIDAFAKRYTPFVITLAACMCTIPWFFGSDVGRRWTLSGLIIIVIACPCALTISTPVTYAAGLAATAQRGVIVKGGARLEALGFVKKVVFDKTGTLTTGSFKLQHLETIGEEFSRREVLELLAASEAPSSHPLSQTLVKAARKEGVSVSQNVQVSDHTILKGEGISAKVNAMTVYVGNSRLFLRLGMYNDLEEGMKIKSDEWSREGGTVGFVGLEGKGIIGAFSVIDTVREEARDVVFEMLESGIEVIMLTGDSDGAAKAIGRQVGIQESYIHSHLLPEDKLHFVGSLKGGKVSPTTIPWCGGGKNRRLVLMCGDGVNDAPALAVADVGVAMGEGAALALEMSDVTLMDSNLAKLLYTIKMGSRVVRTIQENIALSLFAKLLVVALTFAGKMTLFAAIAADVGIMLLVTLNGMKLLPRSSYVHEFGAVKGPNASKHYSGVPAHGTTSPHGVDSVV